MESDAVEEKLLAATAGGAAIADTHPWALAQGLDHDACVGCMKSLMADGYLLSDLLSAEFWVLTEEAEGYVQRGSPEVQVFGFIPAEGGGADEAALVALAGEALVKVGLGKCLKNKWVARDKATGKYSKLVRWSCQLAPGPGCGRASPYPISYPFFFLPCRWLQ